MFSVNKIKVLHSIAMHPAGSSLYNSLVQHTSSHKHARHLHKHGRHGRHRKAIPGHSLSGGNVCLDVCVKVCQVTGVPLTLSLWDPWDLFAVGGETHHPVAVDVALGLGLLAEGAGDARGKIWNIIHLQQQLSGGGEKGGR